MPSPRQLAAWHAEQDRLQSQRRAYWLGLGHVYLRILGFILIFFAALAAFPHH